MASKPICVFCNKTIRVIPKDMQQDRPAHEVCYMKDVHNESIERDLEVVLDLQKALPSTGDTSLDCVEEHDEWTVNFLESLKGQLKNGRYLSWKQHKKLKHLRKQRTSLLKRREREQKSQIRADRVRAKRGM